MSRSLVDVGRLMETSRAYLLLVAQQSLDAGLRIKVAPSDLVQQTFLEAHRDFDRFDGDNADQLRAWLRRILLNNVANCRRDFATAKRDVARETDRVDEVRFHTTDHSPSSQAARVEESGRVERALERLPPQYRQVIDLRNLGRLPFADIGKQLGRSSDAARKLWFRAMQKLRVELVRL